MVLYHPNGRVVIAHENYLEQQARYTADVSQYVDQVDIYNRRNRPAASNAVRIVIEEQDFRTLYCERDEGHDSDSEQVERFYHDGPEEFEVDIDRDTLTLCSNLAREHFQYNPGEDRLHLPVCYPRVHQHGKHKYSVADFEKEFNGRVVEKRYTHQDDKHMAYIRKDEIEKFIIPWLEKVQRHRRRSAKIPVAEPDTLPGKRKKINDNDKPEHYMEQPNGPLRMEIPDDLLEKIHLYNAMLQLGLPKFIQLPLIDALVLQMYRTKLSACHLETLEITVGRFYSRGVAILDPVLNHLIGTYPFRTLSDRSRPEPPESLRVKGPQVKAKAKAPVAVSEEDSPSPSPTDSSQTKRKFLDFAERDVHRGDNLGWDTCVLPPELPVLGHSIKHWSGVRSNGSTAAAHTGFPLNIGRSKKFIRRNAATLLDVNDVVEVDTNRLAGQKYYRSHRPGLDDIPTEAQEESYDNM